MKGRDIKKNVRMRMATEKPIQNGFVNAGKVGTLHLGKQPSRMDHNKATLCEKNLLHSHIRLLPLRTPWARPLDDSANAVSHNSVLKP